MTEERRREISLKNLEQRRADCAMDLAAAVERWAEAPADVVKLYEESLREALAVFLKAREEYAQALNASPS